jgi:hypothetical protein
LIVTSAIRLCSGTNTQRASPCIILAGALWIESFAYSVARPGFWAIGTTTILDRLLKIVTSELAYLFEPERAVDSILILGIGGYLLIRWLLSRGEEPEQQERCFFCRRRLQPGLPALCERCWAERAAPPFRQVGEPSRPDKLLIR